MLGEISGVNLDLGVKKSNSTGGKTNFLTSTTNMLEFKKTLEKTVKELESKYNIADPWNEHIEFGTVGPFNLKEGTNLEAILKLLGHLDNAELKDAKIVGEGEYAITTFKKEALELLERNENVEDSRKIKDVSASLDNVGKLFQNGNFSRIVNIQISSKHEDSKCIDNYLIGITKDKKMVGAVRAFIYD